MVKTGFKDKILFLSIMNTVTIDAEYFSTEGRKRKNTINTHNINVYIFHSYIIQTLSKIPNHTVVYKASRISVFPRTIGLRNRFQGIYSYIWTINLKLLALYVPSKAYIMYVYISVLFT